MLGLDRGERSQVARVRLFLGFNEGSIRVPRGSIYTTMESGPKRPSPLWFWGPNSIIAVYMDPLGFYKGPASWVPSGFWVQARGFRVKDAGNFLLCVLERSPIIDHVGSIHLPSCCVLAVY